MRKFLYRSGGFKIYEVDHTEHYRCGDVIQIRNTEYVWNDYKVREGERFYAHRSENLKFSGVIDKLFVGVPYTEYRKTDRYHKGTPLVAMINGYNVNLSDADTWYAQRRGPVEILYNIYD